MSSTIHFVPVKAAKFHKGSVYYLAIHLDLDSWASFDLESAEDPRHLSLAPADHPVHYRWVSTPH